MLSKSSAHIEWPHSQTRHMVGNVKVLDQEGDGLLVQANLIAFRTKRSVTNTYMAQVRWHLVAQPEGGFRIRWKRVDLDLEGLVPQGKVSIIL
jgi:p-cumate 2,3-dioxygenase beta subunit